MNAKLVYRTFVSYLKTSMMNAFQWQKLKHYMESAYLANRRLYLSIKHKNKLYRTSAKYPTEYNIAI